MNIRNIYGFLYNIIQKNAHRAIGDVIDFWRVEDYEENGTDLEFNEYA